MFFSESVSSVPIMQTYVELSIAEMTSGVNPGELSSTTKSLVERSRGYTSRRNSGPTELA